MKTPPFSEEARKWTGRLLRRVQRGALLAMPLSRPMPIVGERSHELRVSDEAHEWRIIYRIDPEAVLIAEVFCKASRTTPRHVIEVSQWRLKRYDQKRKAR